MSAQLATLPASMPPGDVAERTDEIIPIRTICSVCGDGCEIAYIPSRGAISAAQRNPEAALKGSFLCNSGRLKETSIAATDRLTQPLIRRDLAHALGLDTSCSEGPLAESHCVVDWETALAIVAGQLVASMQTHGSAAIGALISPSCTNEESYLLQKLLRTSLGSNNIDTCERQAYASALFGLELAFGCSAATGPLHDLGQADCILMLGADAPATHPLVGYEITAAVQQGATLIVIDSAGSTAEPPATLHIKPRPGSEVVLLQAIAHVILREHWDDAAFIAGRSSDFTSFAQSIEQITPELAEKETGVPAEQIEQAAYLYALGQRSEAQTQDAASLERGCSAILFSDQLMRRHDSGDLALSLANLALLCGQIGHADTGIYPLCGSANMQGACDMGAQPDLLPGYRPVHDPLARQSVAWSWGLASLPARPGLRAADMLDAASRGHMHALYIVGEHLFSHIGDLEATVQALKELEFLVVQGNLAGPLTQLAHVVLPATRMLEKEGTLTSIERRVQLLRIAGAASGQSMADWRIICALGRRIDAQLDHTRSPWHYESLDAVMREIALVIPIYRGISYERLAEEGVHWPCSSLEHPGTALLHSERFTNGQGVFHSIESTTTALAVGDTFGRAG